MSKTIEKAVDPKLAEALRDLDMIAKGITREDCVRDGIASVRIEGGAATPATEALLAQWVEGDLSDDALMKAVLAPYVGRG